MGVARFIAGQLRQPSGWFGSLLMGRLMNLGNRQIMDRTIELLEVQPQHHVLEIGFGGGYALALLTERITHGAVWGVDVSPEMLRQAECRFRTEIAHGRLRVQAGDVSRLPFPDEIFDRVLTINTIYFWPDTLYGLREIRRVLKPDGRAGVSIRSKEKMGKHAIARHGFRLFSADDLTGAMQQAGFRNLAVEHRDQHKAYDQVIVLGSR